MRPRALIGVLSAALALGGLSLVPASTASAAGTAPAAKPSQTVISVTPYSFATKHRGPMYVAEGQTITNIRGVSAHPGYKAPNFDRIVIDTVRPGAKAGAVGYYAHYVDEVLGIGTGEPLQLSGYARLEVVLRAPTENLDGDFTYETPYDDDLWTYLNNGPHTAKEGVHTWLTNGGRIVDTVSGGSSENWTIIGLGLTKRCPFRVVVLRANQRTVRLAVDIQHC